MHNLSEVISPESLEKIVKKDKKALFAIQKEVNELKRIRYTHLRNIYWVLSFVGFFSILGMVLINNLEDLFYEFLVLMAAILLVAAGAKISIVNKKSDY
jgi:hypothetical protein